MQYTISIIFFLLIFSSSYFSDATPNCSSTNLNLWESYVCEIETANLTQSQCIPTRLVPPSGAVRGLVALFHGYTACPDSFNVLAERLQSNGYVVLSFLTIGHGRKFKDCGEGTICVDNYPVEYLPVNRSGYINFIKYANTIVSNQVELLALQRDIHVIAAAGLSLGGPLATYAVAEGNGMYTHMIVFNPFYGISVPDVDRQVAYCATEPTECLLNFVEESLNLTISEIFEDSNVTQVGGTVISEFSNLIDFSINAIFGTSTIFGGYSQFQSALRSGIILLIEHPSLLPTSILPLLNKDMSWGEGCKEAQKQLNRGGICSFKISNLLAAHSFATYALGRARDIVNMDKTQFITVERDGLTRNGLAYASLNSVSGNTKVNGMCMYRIVNGCNLTGSGNECGVPHSMASRADQSLIAPYYLYWEENYISSTLQWLENDIIFGVPQFKNNRSVCVIADNPDPFFFGEVPVTLNVIVKNIAKGAIREATEAFMLDVLQDLAKRVGFEFKDSFVLTLLQMIPNEKNIQLLIQVSSNFASIFEFHVKSGNTSSLANASIVSIQAENGNIVVPPSPTNSSSPSSSPSPTNSEASVATTLMITICKSGINVSATMVLMMVVYVLLS